MGITRLFMTSRVMGLFLLALSLASCLGQGSDQLHGMYDLSFPSTAVCNAQVKLIPFRNVSDSEIVIEGAAISSGTDPLGNFSLVSVFIGSEERLSINGVLQDIHVPPGVTYSFKITYVPKTENTTHEALLDIAYKEPQEGIIQVVLQGSSASRSNNCPAPPEEGPVDFDKENVLTVELMIAATTPIESPINSDQGQQDFTSVDIPIILDAEGRVATLPAFTGGEFVLPPPRLDVPGIGGIVKGPTVVTIPEERSGTYDPSTGHLEIPNVLIHMDGELDFAADMEVTLTTGRLNAGSISPPVNRNALKQLGSPVHYDAVTNEIFGSPINAEAGKVFLVGLTKMTDVVLKPGSDPRLSGLRSSSMAILIEGTIKEVAP